MTPPNFPTSREEIYNAAKHYTSLGLIVHPLKTPIMKCKSPGKEPFETAWTTREKPRSEADIEHFWGVNCEVQNPPYNIGLLCGSGITVIDLDDMNPAIINPLFKGLNRSKWVTSRRIKGRAHLFFKYAEIKSTKKREFGIEILNKGSNAVLAPSNHKSGTAYIMTPVTSYDDFPVMPDVLIDRLKALFAVCDKLLRAVNKCRQCLKDNFLNYQKSPNVEMWRGGTGRDITLAFMAELYANGAREEELDLACKCIFRENYDEELTAREIAYVIKYFEDGGKPWTCETIRVKCGEITDCASCKHTKEETHEVPPNVLKQCQKNKRFQKLYAGDISDYDNDIKADLAICGILAKYTADKSLIYDIVRRSGLYRDKWEDEIYRNNTIDRALEGSVAVISNHKISIPFNTIGDHILQFDHLFTMRDTNEIYLYQGGVYRSKGTEAILGTKIRELYRQYYANDWMYYNPGEPLEEIPAATTGFVGETISYVRAYSHVDRTDINADRYINFKNGLFDLQEWKFIEHTPEIKSTAQLPVKYDPKAECPEIIRYLKSCELLEENIQVLIEFAGYCLTADVRIQKALMLYGNGSNGKSVFINLLKTILGSDYVSSESIHNLENDKYRVANLYGKRLNAFPDLKDTPLQTTEVFNILTGNDLELIGERKYQNTFSFTPTAKLLFSANKIPFAYSDNYAYYRRWMLIEFPKTFKKSEINKNLIETLTTDTEMSGFVNLMLDGLNRVMEGWEFSYEPGVDEIKKQYMLHSDNIQVFNEKCLRECRGDEDPTQKRIIYLSYRSWCEENKITPVTPTKFTQRLGKLGRGIRETTKRDEDGRIYSYVYYTDTVLM